MSYFKGLKLTKKGEQLQAKINGNLSEILTFTKAELGAGNIANEDEIRFLTTLKEKWGIATISKCELQGENKTMVAIELQFTNAELQENKVFRELGLYARGNDGEEILYAYANAGENYDYIPLMKDSPHSFIITIYFTISFGTKIDANIDLNSYISLKKFNEEMIKKVSKTDVATEGQYGIVKLGIEAGTVLEGKRLSEVMGVARYGGILTQPGQKYKDWAYYDPATKEMFYCKSNNSEVTTSQTYFTPFSNKAILNKLENFLKFNEITLEKYEIRCENVYGGNSNVTDIKFKIPFANKCLFAIANDDVNPGEVPKRIAVISDSLRKDGISVAHEKDIRVFQYIAFGY